MAEEIKYEGELTLQFTCDECGQAVDTAQKTDRYGDITIHVEPCATCVQTARDEGYEEGTADA